MRQAEKREKEEKENCFFFSSLLLLHLWEKKEKEKGDMGFERRLTERETKAGGFTIIFVVGARGPMLLLYLPNYFSTPLAPVCSLPFLLFPLLQKIEPVDA